MKKFYITSEKLNKKGIACLIKAKSPAAAYDRWSEKFTAKTINRLFTEEEWKQMVDAGDRWHIGDKRVCDFKVVSIDELKEL